jgi:hypothetical protein
MQLHPKSNHLKFPIDADVGRISKTFRLADNRQHLRQAWLRDCVPRVPSPYSQITSSLLHLMAFLRHRLRVVSWTIHNTVGCHFVRNADIGPLQNITF